MVFSDSTTKQGIVEEIDFLANSDSNSYPITHKTRNINRWLDRVAFLIQSADQMWQWEDTNNTDLPIAVTDLVSGQTDYSIDTTFLKVLKVMIKDSSGNWVEIQPIDIFDPLYKNLLANTTTGLPSRYDKMGNSIFLFPATNYNSTGGLKIFFQRNVAYFATTDTSKAPGFNPQFHRYLSLGAAFDLCNSKDLPQAKNLWVQIQQFENDIMEFYSNRGKDEPPKIRPIKILSR